MKLIWRAGPAPSNFSKRGGVVCWAVSGPYKIQIQEIHEKYWVNIHSIDDHQDFCKPYYRGFDDNDASTGLEVAKHGAANQLRIIMGNERSRNTTDVEPPDTESVNESKLRWTKDQHGYLSAQLMAGVCVVIQRLGKNDWWWNVYAGGTLLLQQDDYRTAQQAISGFEKIYPKWKRMSRECAKELHFYDAKTFWELHDKSNEAPLTEARPVWNVGKPPWKLSWTSSWEAGAGGEVMWMKFEGAFCTISMLGGTSHVRLAIDENPKSDVAHFVSSTFPSINDAKRGFPALYRKFRNRGDNDGTEVPMIESRLRWTTDFDSSYGADAVVRAKLGPAEDVVVFSNCNNQPLRRGVDPCFTWYIWGEGQMLHSGGQRFRTLEDAKRNFESIYPRWKSETKKWDDGREYWASREAGDAPPMVESRLRFIPYVDEHGKTTDVSIAQLGDGCVAEVYRGYLPSGLGRAWKWEITTCDGTPLLRMQMNDLSAKWSREQVIQDLEAIIPTWQRRSRAIKCRPGVVYLSDFNQNVVDYWANKDNEVEPPLIESLPGIVWRQKGDFWFARIREFVLMAGPTLNTKEEQVRLYGEPRPYTAWINEEGVPIADWSYKTIEDAKNGVATQLLSGMRKQNAGEDEVEPPLIESKLRWADQAQGSHSMVMSRASMGGGFMAEILQVSNRDRRSMHSSPHAYEWNVLDVNDRCMLASECHLKTVGKAKEDFEAIAPKWKSESVLWARAHGEMEVLKHWREVDSEPAPPTI